MVQGFKAVDFHEHFPENATTIVIECYSITNINRKIRHSQFNTTILSSTPDW